MPSYTLPSSSKASDALCPSYLGSPTTAPSLQQILTTSIAMNLPRRLLLSVPHRGVSQKERTQGHHSQPDFRKSNQHKMPWSIAGPIGALPQTCRASPMIWSYSLVNGRNVYPSSKPSSGVKSAMNLLLHRYPNQQLSPLILNTLKLLMKSCF